LEENKKIELGKDYEKKSIVSLVSSKWRVFIFNISIWSNKYNYYLCFSFYI